jgi:hypothetical protein
MHSLSLRATSLSAQVAVVAIPSCGSRGFGGRWIFRRASLGALARTWALLLLLGLACCTDSSGTRALRPAFEVKTPAGIASVSVRESPAGMTDSEFTQLVMAGTKWAALKA